MKKIILIYFVLLFFLTSCGYKEGIVQKAEKSYLKFVGNWQNALVQIDDTTQFKLETFIVSTNETGTTEKKSPEDKLYQLPPGKHTIKIYKDGIMVVNRLLLLENQAIMEVFVP
ncbi:MAG: hypothetical protein AB1325_05690 [Nitrospirota bacterium]